MKVFGDRSEDAYSLIQKIYVVKFYILCDVRILYTSLTATIHSERSINFV